MTPYDIQLIDTDEALNQLAPRLSAASLLALDIETVNWWNRDEERISIIQIGFREESQITVAIFDTLAAAPPEPDRNPRRARSHHHARSRSAAHRWTWHMWLQQLHRRGVQSKASRRASRR